MKYALAIILGLFVQTLPAVAHDHKHKNNNPLDPREQETKDPLKEENTGSEKEPKLHFLNKK